MIGGKIIEIRKHYLRDNDNPNSGVNCMRIWVVGTTPMHDELVVYAEPSDHLPVVGQEIWWQNKTIHFDNDKSTLKKIGYSHGAKPERDY